MFIAKLLVLLLTMIVARSFIHRNTRLVTRPLSRQFLFGNPEPPKNNAPEKKDGGLLGNMGNLMESVKKAQEIAKQTEVLNKQLSETVITGNDASGEVVATFTGLGVPLEIKISDAMAAKGAEAVSLATTEAVKDGHTKSTSNMMAKMGELYKGLPMGPKA